VTLLAALLALLLGAAAVYGAVYLFKARNYGPFIVGLPFEGGLLSGLLLTAALLTLGLRFWLLRRDSALEVLAGALMPWVALTGVATATLPGMSYLFLWPAFCGSIALLFEDGLERNPRGCSLRRVLLTAVPAPLLLSPGILQLHQAITLGIAPLSMALVTLALGLMPKPSESPRVPESGNQQPPQLQSDVK
jgi:hypothetical protein